MEEYIFLHIFGFPLFSNNNLIIKVAWENIPTHLNNNSLILYWLNSDYEIHLETSS